jgi:hypothetical protein
MLDESTQRRISLCCEVRVNTYIDFRAVAEGHFIANKSASLYFLLDHAGMPGLHRKLSSTVEWASLFEDTAESNALRVAPILLLIGGHGKIRIPQPLFEWIAENGTYTSSVIMLASILQISPLRSRLSSRLHVRLSGDMDGMLRFFDPRIFEKLISVLSVDQSRDFFSPAEKWWHVGRVGQLGIIHTEFDSEEIFTSPLELSEAQEFQLLDASEADQVLALLRQNASNLLAGLPFVQQYDFVLRQIEKAKTFGLVSTIDFAIYSAAALRYGEHFANSELWASVWNDVRAGGLSFSQAVRNNDFVDKEKA